jgi:hypothetical protein
LTSLALLYDKAATLQDSDMSVRIAGYLEEIKNSTTRLQPGQDSKFNFFSICAIMGCMTAAQALFRPLQAGESRVSLVGKALTGFQKKKQLTPGPNCMMALRKAQSDDA